MGGSPSPRPSRRRGQRAQQGAEPAHPCFIFDPPLPNLWSSYEPTPAQLRDAVDGAAARALYDKVLRGFELGADEPLPEHRVPRHPFGRTCLTLPVLSLGGFVSLGLTVMRNRKLRRRAGCGCKATHYVGVHAVLLPLALAALPWLCGAWRQALVGWLLPACVVAALPSWGVSALLSVGTCALWVIGTMLVLAAEHPHHVDKLMRYAYGLGVDHVETARHYLESEAQLRPLLRRYREEGTPWTVQTKIRPVRNGRWLRSWLRRACVWRGVRGVAGRGEAPC
jgi:hypothetical protein